MGVPDITNMFMAHMIRVVSSRGGGGTSVSKAEEECATMYMVTVDKNKCDGDGNCVNVCPQSVFKLDGGKADPVNMSECINCLTCAENCPQQAITVTEI